MIQNNRLRAKVVEVTVVKLRTQNRNSTLTPDFTLQVAQDLTQKEDRDTRAVFPSVGRRRITFKKVCPESKT